MVQLTGKCHNVISLVKGGWPVIEIGAERCCNQRLLPLAAMLDLGTSCGVSYPLKVVPPPLGRAAVTAFMTSHPRGVGLDECPP